MRGSVESRKQGCGEKWLRAGVDKSGSGGEISFGGRSLVRGKE
jgi:hypothetical protein